MRNKLLNRKNNFVKETVKKVEKNEDSGDNLNAERAAKFAALFLARRGIIPQLDKIFASPNQLINLVCESESNEKDMEKLTIGLH